MNTETTNFTQAERQIMSHNFPRMTQFPGSFSTLDEVREDIRVEYPALTPEAQEYFAERIWDVNNAWLEAMDKF